MLLIPPLVWPLTDWLKMRSVGLFKHHTVLSYCIHTKDDCETRDAAHWALHKHCWYSETPRLSMPREITGSGTEEFKESQCGVSNISYVTELSVKPETGLLTLQPVCLKGGRPQGRMLVGGERRKRRSSSHWDLPLHSLSSYCWAYRAHGCMVLKLASNRRTLEVSWWCSTCAPVRPLPCQVQQLPEAECKPGDNVCVEEKRGRECTHTHTCSWCNRKKTVITMEWRFLKGKREEERFLVMFWTR